MPQPFQTRYLGLGGINNSRSDELIGDDELSDARNYMPDYTGQAGLVKREGSTKAVTQNYAGAITSIYGGKNLNPYVTVQKTAGGATSIYDLDDSATELDADLTTDVTGPYWTTFATYDIMVNGAVARKTDDSTTWSAVDDMPAGTKYVASAGNFLYYAGYTSAPGSLAWFDIGTLTYSATNALVLTQDENDDITGLVPWSNGVMVFFEKSLRLVVGDSNLEKGVAWACTSEGCISQKSIVITPVGIFFMSKKGLTWLKLDFTLDYPMMRKVPYTFGMDTYYGRSKIMYDPIQEKVIFTAEVAPFGGGGGVTLRGDYYFQADRMYVHSFGVTVNSLGYTLTSTAGSAMFTPYIGGTNYVYSISGDTDDGTAISAYMETKREANAGPDVLKLSRKVKLTTDNASPCTVTYGCYIDNETTLDANNIWNLTDTPVGPYDTVIGTNRQHYKIKHRIADSSPYRNKIVSLSHDGMITRQI